MLAKDSFSAAHALTVQRIVMVLTMFALFVWHGAPLLLATVLTFGMFMVVYVTAVIVTNFAGVKNDL